MKLEVIHANQLTPKECAALKRLTLGRVKGQMLEALEEWQYDPDTKVVRLSDDDGRVLSWALLFLYDSRGNKDFMIYTRASERGKGYGTLVYNKAVQVARGRKNIIVHPWSDASINFFNTLHYTPQNLPNYSTSRRS